MEARADGLGGPDLIHFGVSPASNRERVSYLQIQALGPKYLLHRFPQANQKKMEGLSVSDTKLHVISPIGTYRRVETGTTARTLFSCFYRSVFLITCNNVTN